jgi:type I restriction enzyme S subunit
MSDVLPKGWCTTNLESIAFINMGQSPKSIYYNSEGKGLPFFQGKAEFGHVNPTPKKWCTNPSKIAERNDILLSIRAPVGPTNLCSEQSCIGRGLAAIRGYHGIDQNFLYYYFKNIEGWLQDQGTGSTFQAINGGFIKQLSVKVPPANEQKRIAEKLEQLLTAVDATKNRLDKVPTILKRFRQSVLAAAVSGELTKDWRAKNEITKKWSKASLESIATSITDGDHQAPPKVDNGIPFLVISNLSTGKLNFGSVTRFVPQKYYDSLKETRVPKPGDILYTVTGSFGIPVIVDDDRKFCFQRHIAIIKPNHEIVNNKYLMYALSSNDLMTQAISCATGTAQKTVPLRGLRKFTIPMPSKIEQLEISARVDTLFKFVASCEDQLKRAQQKVTSIHASILAKAFRGELVPQDPNEEPAAIILERIRAERQATKPGKKTGKKK